MQFADFRIGSKFRCGGKTWLCTDIGTRTIVAVCLTVCRTNDWARFLPEDEQQRMWEQDALPEVDSSWVKGPPYPLAEHVFDENDIEGCVAV